jgi:predicted kinase
VKTLHIVAGLPASGKSTYGRALAKERRAAFLDIDSASEPIVRAGLSLAGQDPDDRDSAVFKNAFRSPIYDTLFQVARENLCAIDVVIAGPFTAELRDPDWPAKLEAELSARVEIHYTSCDSETRRRRMIERGEARDASKLENWSVHLAYYKDAPRPACPHSSVDTSET